MIQSKIVCEYICDGMLKGFTQNMQFFEPKSNLKEDKLYSNITLLTMTIFTIIIVNTNPFPMIRTLKNNVPYGKVYNQKEDRNNFFIKKSLPMIGRKYEFETCLSDLEQIYKLGRKDLILVRGVTGSGKSHFIRKVLWHFLESNKELKVKNNSKPLIFCSYQTTISFTEPMNGWRNILKDIYNLLKETNKTKTKFVKKFDKQVYEFTCDGIGKLIFETESYSFLNYLNEIFEVNLNDHFEINTKKFSEEYLMAQLPVIDYFFEQRKFDTFDKYIINFCVELIKLYHSELSGAINQSQIPTPQDKFLNYPLIFVIEDSNCIDEVI